MDNNKSIRIFVAMPGTNMGESAKWKDPEQIKRHFFEKIRDKLKKDTHYQVELVVEKDKVLSGPIHSSMFKEAWEADVYIADLTGNNPNVYLELGVRWALKDNVTIVVSQNVEDIKFNVASSRAIPYSLDLDQLSKAIEQVVQAIVEAQSKKTHIDSPVRWDRQITAVNRADIQAYEEKIARLQKEITTLETRQGIDYLTAGQASENSEFRIKMFRQAIETNETLIEAYIELGMELRNTGNYTESISVLEKGIVLQPELAVLHRELGIAFNRQGLLEKAVVSLRESVKRNRKDAEALSSLGGALRRLGIKMPPNEYDWAILREARECYAEASELEVNDHYALGNLARLDLILSKVEDERKREAIDELDTLKYLCEFLLKKNPDDIWLKFDLADTYLLTDDVDTGYHLYYETIRLIPSTYRKSILTSVISPLNDFLTVDVVKDEVKTTIQKIIEEFTLIMSQS